MLCTPSAAAPTSSAPRSVNAAAGALARPGSKANDASTRATASVGSLEPCAHAPPRLEQPRETTRTTPLFAPGRNSTLNAGAACAGAASGAWPAAGQAHCQPASARTQAGCKPVETPALFHCAALKPAPGVATRRYRSRNEDPVVSPLALQSSPMRATLLSCACAHSNPASAASKA